MLRYTYQVMLYFKLAGEKGFMVEWQRTSGKMSYLWSVCNTLVHIKRMELMICTMYQPPDAPNYGDSFKESLQETKEVLTSLDDNLHTSFRGFQPLLCQMSGGPHDLRHAKSH